MVRSFNANAIARVFANRKDRVVIKAKTNDRGALHAAYAHFYCLCERLRGLLSASTGDTTWQTQTSMQPASMQGMQPCLVVVRRVSPVVEVA